MSGEEKSGQYSRGVRAFKSGDYQAAVELLSEAVEFDENNDRAWNALGTACAKIGRYEDADLCFSNAITIAPDNPIYLKNQRTNAKHLKTPSLHVTSKSPSFRDRLPLKDLPLDQPFLLVGAAIVAIIIIGILLFTIIPIFSTPAVPVGPALSISVNLTGNSVILTNGGGRDIGKISSLSWKVNNVPAGILNTPIGSTAQITLSDLISTNLSSGMRVVIIATYHDGSQILALDKTLPPPPPEVIPTGTVTPTPTPTLPPDVPRYQAGEILLDEKTNEWWIVNATPVNGSYSLSHTARVPDGSFTSLGSTSTNLSFKSAEQQTRSLGTRVQGGTPAGLPGITPPPVAEIPTVHPEPVYPAGDLVNAGSSNDNGMIVILGYDQATDQYQADAIYRYYTGEWGYRENSTSKWYVRSILERQYPVRAGRIAISDVGIGADSAPPRTPIKYGPGDIISPDPSGIDHTKVILDYNKTDDRYKIDGIAPAYNGGWKLGGLESWEKRVFIERDYPYQLRKIDLSLIRTG